MFSLFSHILSAQASVGGSWHYAGFLRKCHTGRLLQATRFHRYIQLMQAHCWKQSLRWSLHKIYVRLDARNLVTGLVLQPEKSDLFGIFWHGEICWSKGQTLLRRSKVLHDGFESPKLCYYMRRVLSLVKNLLAIWIVCFRSFVDRWHLDLGGGEMIQFDEHIFQLGWFNHQLGTVWKHTESILTV